MARPNDAPKLPDDDYEYREILTVQSSSSKNLKSEERNNTHAAEQSKDTINGADTSVHPYRDVQFSSVSSTKSQTLFKVLKVPLHRDAGSNEHFSSRKLLYEKIMDSKSLYIYLFTVRFVYTLKSCHTHLNE